MGNAAGHGSNGFHLVCLLQLRFKSLFFFFGLYNFGKIFGYACKAGNISFAVL